MAQEKTIRTLFAKARGADRLLYDWMRANHDDLVLELGAGRVAWRSAMQVIAELQLVDARGRTPSKDTAFRTWRRVRSDIAAAQNRNRAQTSTVLASGEIALGVYALHGFPTSTAPTADVRLAATQPRIRLEIRPARILTELPDPAIEKQPVAGGPLVSFGAPTPSEHAAKQLQSVLDTIGAARVPMPKRVL